VNAQTIGDASLELTPDTHFLSSIGLIKDAMLLADSGRVAVLGCGRCSEIPVRLLGKKFDRVDLIDIDRAALEFVEAECRKWDDGREVCKFHCADLTGLIAEVERRASELVANSDDPMACLEQLGMLLERTTPRFWKPADNRQYDLLVCSGVLTQLQASVRERAERIYVGKFSDYAPALSKHESWRVSAWNFARSLEDRFIEHLGKLTKSRGIVYLSDTVHVSWLSQLDHRSVCTDGRWIALRTAQLADYLRPSDTIIHEQRWDWLREEREGNYWGRLYDVQAVIYRNA
jgi:hypothetical protein